MASFDIIDSASAGYALVWKERSYLIKLASVPFLIKLVCFTAVLMLGWEGNFTRQALIMLPSFFADGWLLAHLVRLVFFEQRWPFRPSGNAERDMGILRERALGIMRGTLTFAVIKYLMAGLTALIYAVNEAGMGNGADGVSPGEFAVALSFLVFGIWAFRLVWLHIPAAVNYPLGRFLRGLGGYSASWHLIGIWLFCFIPLFFVLGMALSLLSVSAQAPGAASPEVIFVATFLRVLLDTLVGILSTAGVALAVKKYLVADRKAG